MRHDDLEIINTTIRKIKYQRGDLERLLPLVATTLTSEILINGSHVHGKSIKLESIEFCVFRLREMLLNQIASDKQILLELGYCDVGLL